VGIDFKKVVGWRGKIILAVILRWYNLRSIHSTRN
jgi:hypothetical protein